MKPLEGTVTAIEMLKVLGLAVERRLGASWNEPLSASISVVIAITLEALMADPETVGAFAAKALAEYKVANPNKSPTEAHAMAKLYIYCMRQALTEDGQR